MMAAIIAAIIPSTKLRLKTNKTSRQAAAATILRIQLTLRSTGTFE